MIIINAFYENSTFIIRILLSALCGFIIGFERANKNKDAGIRTHSIVAVASCLCMIISAYAFDDFTKYDPTRMAAQVISGIGFLGAGIIFVKRGEVISGLTTAAGIWTTAIIGMSIGTGMIFIGFFATFLIFLIQFVATFSRNFIHGSHYLTISLATDDNNFNFEKFFDYFEVEKINLFSIESENTDTFETTIFITAASPGNFPMKNLSKYLSTFPGVKNYKVKSLHN